jgi:hypothetical protein
MRYKMLCDWLDEVKMRFLLLLVGWLDDML